MKVINGVLTQVTDSDIVNGTFEFPEGVTSIGEHAFSGSELLKKIAIPSSVTSIGAWAFGKCISLQQVTIPPSVYKISPLLFEICPSLVEINGQKCKQIEFGVAVVKEEKQVDGIDICLFFEPLEINKDNPKIVFYATSGKFSGIGYTEKEAVDELKKWILNSELNKVPVFMDTVITYDRYCADDWTSHDNWMEKAGDRELFSNGLTVREILPILEKHDVAGWQGFKIGVEDSEKSKQ